MPERSLIRGLIKRSRIILPLHDEEAGEQFSQASLSLTTKPTTLQTEYYDGLSPTHTFLGSAVD